MRTDVCGPLAKVLGPNFRRDDGAKYYSVVSVVIPAKAGTQSFGQEPVRTGS